MSKIKHTTEIKCWSSTSPEHQARGWRCNLYQLFYLACEYMLIIYTKIDNQYIIIDIVWFVLLADYIIQCSIYQQWWQQVMLWCHFSACRITRRHTGRGLEVLLALVRGARRQAGHPDPPSWTFRKPAEAATTFTFAGYRRRRCYFRRGGWRTRHYSTFRC